MMNPEEKARRWRWLESLIDKIQDPVLRNSYLYELSERAKRDWGYCPSNRKIEEPELVLEDWEQEFLEEVKIAAEYGVAPNEPSKGAWFSMMDFIRHGGELSDIPDDIRSDTIDKLYTECLFAYGREIDAQMEHLL